MKRKRRCLGMGEDKGKDRISSLPEDKGEDRISSLPEDKGRDRISSLPEDKGEDRISSLPEDKGEDRISSFLPELLSRILFKIPDREAVRTVTLSSLWKNHWTLKTSLNLAEKSDERAENFAGMIEALERCQLLKIICLTYQAGGKCRDLSLVNKWISSAVNRKPKLLFLILAAHIDFRKGEGVLSSYPTCNITYNTCLVLKLGLFFKVNIPDSLASFPCLKVLYFMGRFPYENHSSALDRLISHSPVLEIIQLKGFLDSKMEFLGSKTKFEFDSRIPSLRMLELRLHTDVDRVHPHTVTIAASKLQFLYIEDKTCAKYVMENLGSLEFVQLDYGAPWSDDPEDELITRLHSLLCGIAKTKKLGLSADSLLNLELSVTQSYLTWPQFSHLTTLELRGCGIHKWTLLLYFLKNSPKLESLRLYKFYVKNHPWDNVDDQYERNPLDNIPDCLKMTLKHVEFLSFEGREDELQLAEYFLKNAQVLQVMKINTYHYPVKDELKERLRMCKTASKTCQVHFYENEKSMTLLKQEYHLQVEPWMKSIKATA